MRWRQDIVTGCNSKGPFSLGNNTVMGVYSVKFLESSTAKAINTGCTGAVLEERLLRWASAKEARRLVRLTGHSFLDDVGSK